MTTEEFSVAVPTIRVGHMRLASGFPSLYYYELKSGSEVKARKYAIPVVEKSGKVRVLKGDSVEEVVRHFRKEHLSVGKMDRKTAARLLTENHGLFIKPEKWGVSKFVDLGEFDPSEEDDEKFVQNMNEMLKSMLG